MVSWILKVKPFSNSVFCNVSINDQNVTSTEIQIMP